MYLMKILVTGGAGFIGSHVVDRFLANGHTVAIIDDLSTGKKSRIPAGVKLYEGSIENPEFVEHVFDDFQPEIIDHHAAHILVVVSLEKPIIDAQKNIIGTINLLEKASKLKSLKKFIYASSGGAMYGNPAKLPCLEDDLAKPISPYGLSKHTAERYVWLLCELYGIPATVLRYSNVFGPRQDPHGEAGVCAIFCGKMLDGETGTIFGDGSQIRDYVYVEDVAEANLLALEKGEGEYFNVATGVGTSTLQVFEAIKKVTGFEGEPIMGEERVGEVQAVVLATQKAVTGLGFKAKNNFEEGIKKTIDWYKL